MKTITTRNSTYEVDEDSKRVRRVKGTGSIPTILGGDGEWAEYDSFWPGPWDGLTFVNKAGKGFVTSTVQTIEEETA